MESTAINDDVSTKLKLRAVNGYGMKIESFLDNIPLLDGDKEPEPLWRWLELIRITEGFDSMDGISFRGVRSILSGKDGKDETERINARKETVPWDSAQSSSAKDGVIVFISSERDHILRLSGWSTSRDSTVESLLNQGKYERAAAICIFHMNLSKAIEIFQTTKGRSTMDKPYYSILAVALSGFSNSDQSSAWQSLCSAVTNDIDDPYIRNSFKFLSASRSREPELLREIAMDEGMILEDRLAFACTFFPDGRLVDFIRDLTESYVKKGLLEGLALTGFRSEGVELVQSYVDMTCDVQTASLLSSYVTTREWSEDPRPQQWIEHYREALDSFMFWEARAVFDVFNSRIKGGGPRIPRQVTATCTYCGKSISHPSGGQSFSGRLDKIPIARTPNVSEIPKVMTCSSCGKTLPRCALCQINMGTPTNMGFVMAEMDDQSVKKATRINPLEKWFTWCQSCRHGGHAAHVADWFKDHIDCPVTGCGCKCMMIESGGTTTLISSRRRAAVKN